MKQEQQFTRYEITRILGARALQIAMNAPILLKVSDEELEKMRYDPLKIAEMEFDSDVLPITVKRPLPEKSEEKLKKIIPKKEEEKTDAEKEKEAEKQDKEVEKLEEKEEMEIEKEGEIMELATPEDEREEETPKEQVIEE